MEYLVRGKGAKTFVCFHGHGLNMHYFEFLADHFDDVRVLSFNIFGHGKSQLLENDLHHSNLQELFQKIFEKEGVEQFTSIGYSLGGKFALNMVNYFPEKIEKAVLIASEGIKANNFYNFSSRIWLMRRLYKLSIENPAWVFSLAKFLRKIRVFSPSMMKFIDLQMGDRDKRIIVYNTWAKFRFIFPNQGRLKKNFHDQNIDLVLVMGSKDRIIKPEQGKYFIRKMGKGEYRELPVSHDVFRQDYLQILTNELEDII